MTFDGVTVKYAGGRFLMNHRVQRVLSLEIVNFYTIIIYMHRVK